jgi:hypothetical protein
MRVIYTKLKVSTSISVEAGEWCRRCNNQELQADFDQQTPVLTSYFLSKMPKFANVDALEKHLVTRCVDFVLWTLRNPA